MKPLLNIKNMNFIDGKEILIFEMYEKKIYHKGFTWEPNYLRVKELYRFYRYYRIC